MRRDPLSRVRVGVCSWADAALIEAGTFYPRRSMTAEARLRHYAQVFDTVEVNASFYAIPAARSARLWVERTPPHFVFNIKAHALMTGHHPQAAGLPAEVQRLLPDGMKPGRRGQIEASAFPPAALDACFPVFRDALAPLAESGKLGYVLFQLAPWVRYGPAALDYLASLPGRLPGLRIAVEFRDRSWFPAHARESLEALAAAGLAHVVADAPPTPNAVPRVTERTASVAVLRLHGRNARGWLRQLRGEEPTVREKYDYLYADSELAALVPDVERLAREAEDTYVMFNNNNRDYPVRNALMMRHLLGQGAPAAPVLAGEPPGDLFAGLP
jgi:uncharacterized protein YecE (DUF72 family)